MSSSQSHLFLFVRKYGQRIKKTQTTYLINMVAKYEFLKFLKNDNCKRNKLKGKYSIMN